VSEVELDAFPAIGGGGGGMGGAESTASDTALSNSLFVIPVPLVSSEL
jgi:hypothetical protein